MQYTHNDKTMQGQRHDFGFAMYVYRTYASEGRQKLVQVFGASLALF